MLRQRVMALCTGSEDLNDADQLRRLAGLRMPSHPVALELIRRAGIPVAAPSANPFGYVSPTTAEHVRQGLGSRIRSILDGGPSQIGLESTIVDMRDPGRPRLLRPGAVTRREIEKVLGVDIPHIVIPVRPGRDLARLIEVAAFQTKLKMSGHNAAQELNDRLIAHMSRGNPPPAA